MFPVLWSPHIKVIFARLTPNITRVTNKLFFFPNVIDYKNLLRNIIKQIKHQIYLYFSNLGQSVIFYVDL